MSNDTRPTPTWAHKVLCFAIVALAIGCGGVGGETTATTETGLSQTIPQLVQESTGLCMTHVATSDTVGSLILADFTTCAAAGGVSLASPGGLADVATYRIDHNAFTVVNGAYYCLTSGLITPQTGPRIPNGAEWRLCSTVASPVYLAYGTVYIIVAGNYLCLGDSGANLHGFPVNDFTAAHCQDVGSGSVPPGYKVTGANVIAKTNDIDSSGRPMYMTAFNAGLPLGQVLVETSANGSVINGIIQPSSTSQEMILFTGGNISNKAFGSAPAGVSLVLQEGTSTTAAKPLWFRQPDANNTNQLWVGERDQLPLGIDGTVHQAKMPSNCIGSTGQSTSGVSMVVDDCATMGNRAQIEYIYQSISFIQQH